MKVLVTGAAGFIGSHIVDELIYMGCDVISIDNESSESNDQYYWNNRSKNYKYDICNYDLIRPLFDEVDFVIHAAAEARIQPTILNPIQAVKTNSLGTAIVLQCAKEAGVKRFIYSSTSSAYGMNLVPNIETQTDDCLNPYSISKVYGEKLCSMYTKLFGLNTIILRYFNVYGERQPTKGQYATVIGIFYRQKEAGTPLTIVGSGNQKRDFTNVKDVVTANIMACIKEIDKEYFGTIFNIGSGINYSINEIANMISNNKINISDRPGEAKETLADISKSKSILGWEPTIFIKDWLAQNK